MKRSEITPINARLVAEKGELAAVVFCRDKYRYWQRYGLPQDGYPAISCRTCPLCIRHKACVGCPLSMVPADPQHCCYRWVEIGNAANAKNNTRFRIACRALADRLAEIAKELKAKGQVRP